MSDITVTTTAPGCSGSPSPESGASTTHEVTADSADLERVGHGAAAERVIAASFRFLLDREPTESILRRFDVSVIGRYFPEYESRVAYYL
jgi:hypothetical protein